MPQMNIFGEWEYSAEELKQIEKEKKEKEKADAEAKKQAEEEAARLKSEAEERKAKEKELKKKITERKKEIKTKLNELLLDSADNEESMTQIEEAKTQVDALDNLLELDTLWKSFDEAYNAMVAVKKQKEKETKEKDEEAKAKKYKFPFLMYFGHEYRDVTGVFEEGKEYSEKQLTKILIDHGFKDFKYAQEIQWEYFEDENCLYPKFKLGNRG